MADVQNLTQVILCSVPIDNTYENQLDFANTTQQRDYFSGKALHTFNNLTYQRKDSTIDLPISVDSLWGVNYVMYQNANFGSKWFYAFIDRMEYISPNNSRIVITTDAWQTWQFNINFGKCYVEREHTNVNETISVEEGLDAGNEYVLRKQVHLWDRSGIGPDYFVVMTETVEDIMKSKYWDKQEPSSLNGPNGSTPSCVHYYYFDSSFRAMLKMPATDEERNILNNPLGYTNPVAGSEDWYGKVTEMSKVLNTMFVGNSAAADVIGYIPGLDKYQKTRELVKERAARFASAIVEIFRLPADPTDLQYQTDSYGCRRVVGLTSDLRFGSASSGVTSDYFSEPKLNYYPYSYFKVTNHKGSAQVFKPEYVSNPHISYTLGFGSPVTIRYWCDNYQGSGNQKDKSVISNTNNTLPVLNDQYGAYLMTSKTQNDVAITNSIVGGAVSVGTGAASAGLGFALGGPMGALVGGLAGVASSAIGGLSNVYKTVSGINAKKQDLQGQPPTVTGNSNNGDFDYNDGEDGVWVELWTINDQHGGILSDYFNRYGYQINRVKVPNFKGRSGFNFVKTTDAMITGGVPMNDLDQIKQMFNNGVTIWHDPWNVGNY